MGTRRPLGQYLRELPVSAHLVLPPGPRRALRRRLGVYYPWEEEFDFTPPAARPGEVTGQPDFVGIGVQKAGTSWWFDLISRHPDAAGPIPGPDNPVQKERHFFTRFGTRTYNEADAERYRGWFPRPPGKVIGEWTPDYMTYPWVPALLARAAPQAKLLVIVRDPVERFRSGLTHAMNQGAEISGATVAAQTGHGFYASHLRRWLDYFPRDRFLVFQYEGCVRDTSTQLAATYRFLGLAPFVPPALERRVGATLTKKLPLDADVRRRLVELYRSEVEELWKLFPELDPGLWPAFTGDAASASSSG